ncbi:MAG: transcription antitermination factor NusB [Actinobacteria bacterium]|nr:transcription antitermination factor NusB [Actinomycetota bacterium]|tara:strand:+ start:3959 stop:4378 length:420 start_codon:yes stop_codon:yes gene_type:complete
MSEFKQQRKKAREAVLQALYAKHVSDESQEKVLHDIFHRYDFDSQTKKFVEKLFTETIENVEMLDKKIELNLDNWTIDRLNVIDRLIIQMSISEMIFLKDFDISHKVTISSALENAKKFSSEDSTSFVNGVLDTIYKDL